MPAHQIDLQDPKAVSRLLLAVVLSGGGELRLPAHVYDGIDRGRLLLVDFDREKSELVISATSDWGRAITITPESYAWTQPANVAPLERQRVAAEVSAAKTSMHSDEELAEMEETMQRNQKLARDVAEGKNPLRIRTVK